MEKECNSREISQDTDTKNGNRKLINQIDGWKVAVSFNNNGFSLEKLVEEYIKEKFLTFSGWQKTKIMLQYFCGSQAFIWFIVN